MGDSPVQPRAKRQKIDKGGRFAAFERLRSLKGSKNKCQIEKEVDNVYDIVEEREYVKKAAKLYGNDWIEDDGTGYTEDGRDFFEDEEYSDGDNESISQKGNRKSQADSSKRVGSKKRPRDETSPVKGKNSIRNLFSGAVTKRTATNTIKDDDILADILGELEKPQEEKQPIKEIPKNVSSSMHTQKTINSTHNVKKIFPTNQREEEKKEEVTVPSKAVGKVTAEHDELASSNDWLEEEMKPSESVMESSKPMTEQTTSNSNKEDPSTYQKEIENAAIQQKQTESKSVEVEKKNSLKDVLEEGSNELGNFLAEWENLEDFNVDYSIEDAKKAKEISSTDNVELDANGHLRFWYWEAWENLQRNGDEVFLFGRLPDGQSVTVRIEQIERILYLLPREYMLDAITKEITDTKVTLADVYNEFMDTISTQLKLDTFRARKVTKNFAYHPIGVEVPQQCEYIEIRYDGKQATPDPNAKYNSIAHIFGTTSTALERFLLEYKIKGPCWLELTTYKRLQQPLNWTSVDVHCSDPKYLQLVMETKSLPSPPPPLILVSIYIRTVFNLNSMKNEICMISVLVNNCYYINRPAPTPPFSKHFCGFTRPSGCAWPFDLAAKLSKFGSNKIEKFDTEGDLLKWFLNEYQKIDADLVVSFDIMDCQLDTLIDRILHLKVSNWSRLGRLRLSKSIGRKMLDFFAGRMICDVKRSAEECIKSRSYDLFTLCQNVLHVNMKHGLLTSEEIWNLYQSGEGILKLVTYTMQDASYVLRLMFELNIMPLALQITNICGNMMTRTLQSGRSERNEYLLLHAFTERNYIVPDRKKRDISSAVKLNSEPNDYNDTTANTTTSTAGASNRKKAAYSGGLVLDPIRGFYDKYILLMDFNSLYPSIIQEYNICFTTVQQPLNVDTIAELPDAAMEAGILPQQLKRLVDSRREVKKLLASSDLTAELKLQYHIRQMALKLTANSMYGCLGFGHSRFFAQHLAALVTHMGREILMNTKALVQNLKYEVVYGDTDSIMIKTNLNDYDQVIKIGNTIKQNINKLHKQLEIDVDGVFSCLLLLKKKKYAAVKVSKNAKGELRKEQEHKGLDIVRRDWSHIAVTVGKAVLDEILSEQSYDDKVFAICSYLEKIRNDLKSGTMSFNVFLITKQLSKAPTEFTNIKTLPHVQVALRMNKKRQRRYKKGDMVDYIICNDGTSLPSTQRAYHIDELNSGQSCGENGEKLQVDIDYYLAHQIHPVVSRLVEVLEGIDSSRVADCLGLDGSKFKSVIQKSISTNQTVYSEGDALVENSTKRFSHCEKFKFVCGSCNAENIISSAFRPSNNGQFENVLDKCCNPDCPVPPHRYITFVRNHLIVSIRNHIKRYYQNWMICDNPSCNYNTQIHSHCRSIGLPVCMTCRNGSLVQQFNASDLYLQLEFLRYIFDTKAQQLQSNYKAVAISTEAAAGYTVLKEIVEQYLLKSAYADISLGDIFGRLTNTTPA